MKKLNILYTMFFIFCATHTVVAQNQELIRISDSLAMIPPLVNTNPGKKYNAKNLDYGMTIGIERTPGGRIWAEIMRMLFLCWLGVMMRAKSGQRQK